MMVSDFAPMHAGRFAIVCVLTIAFAMCAVPAFAAGRPEPFCTGGGCAPPSVGVGSAKTVYVGLDKSQVLPPHSARAETLAGALALAGWDSQIILFKGPVPLGDVKGENGDNRLVIRRAVTILKAANAKDLIELPCGLVIRVEPPILLTAKPTETSDIVRFFGVAFRAQSSDTCITVKEGDLQLANTQFNIDSGDPVLIDVEHGSLETDPNYKDPAQLEKGPVADFSGPVDIDGRSLDVFAPTGTAGTGIVVEKGADLVTLRNLIVENLKVGLDLRGSADIGDSVAISGNGTGAVVSAPVGPGRPRPGEPGQAVISIQGAVFAGNHNNGEADSGYAIRVTNTFAGELVLDGVRLCGTPALAMPATSGCGSDTAAVPEANGMFVDALPITGSVFMNGGVVANMANGIVLYTPVYFGQGSLAPASLEPTAPAEPVPTTVMSYNQMGVRFFNPSFFLDWRGLEDVVFYSDSKQDQVTCDKGWQALPRKPTDVREIVRRQCRSTRPKYQPGPPSSIVMRRRGRL
jgi:hypothetical protein